MFAPRNVALIGATEHSGSVGRTVFENLLANDFGGTVFPVNPKHRTVLGHPTFARIGDIPASIDLAVIATPAAAVPGVVAECTAAGVRGAVIISAGFRESGEAGKKLEQEIFAHTRGTQMRIIGPNCLGVMLPHAGLNATFAAGMAQRGTVGFISQSGALCTAVLDWSLRENVGFSAFFSVGSMTDVGWGDLIYWLGDDPHTRSIVIYMESVGNARAFLSAAREVALSKPIIVIKVGRTAEASRAAASHTGSLTGSDEVLDAAFRRAGVLRVNTIEELFDMAEVLAKQPRPRGPRLAIVTNAGGPAALATDRLVLDGGEIAALSDDSTRQFNELLPAHWSHGNPVDILGDADAVRYTKAVEIAARDKKNDGVLVILTPQAMTECAATATGLARLARSIDKPLLASWMGGTEVGVGDKSLNDAGIPTFAFPDTAARAFATMWRYSRQLDALYETPQLVAHAERTRDHKQATNLISAARKKGRTLLTECESKKLLECYHIPTVATRIATTEEQAVERAGEFGGPVVLKLHSETITHKTDVGGVKLNLTGATAVRRAWREIRRGVPAADFLGVTVQPMIQREGYELILGSSIDSQFGPVLLFGTGGQLVEVFKDRALGLPPLNATLARRLIEQTRIYTALQGTRGRGPVDFAALEDVLVSFSQLVAEQRWIKEIDINPLLVSERQIIALDARVILHPRETAENELPTLAIRPYPIQYCTEWKLRGGPSVMIRPVRPEDEPLMIDFHHTLSEQSVHYRYFSAIGLEERVAHERLRRICFNDYDREIALVAVQGKGGTQQIIGVGRLSRLHHRDEAEFAIIIGDPWQKKGLGKRLLDLLVEIGREEKIARITAHILSDNLAMQHVSRKCGFKLHRTEGEMDWRAEIRL